MKTKRDDIELKEKFEELYKESYRKAKHDGNLMAAQLLIGTIIGGLFGWFVVGPFLASL